MSTEKIPVYEECPRVEAYETKVKAWLEITKLAVKDRAIHLTLAMIEKADEVSSNVTLDTLKSDEGVTIASEPWHPSIQDAINLK